MTFGAQNRRIPTANPAVHENQRAIGDLLKRLENNPFIDGELLADDGDDNELVVATGGTEFSHSLGREPNGFIVVDRYTSAGGGTGEGIRISERTAKSVTFVAASEFAGKLWIY